MNFIPCLNWIQSRTEKIFKKINIKLFLCLRFWWDRNLQRWGPPPGHHRPPGRPRSSLFNNKCWKLADFWPRISQIFFSWSFYVYVLGEFVKSEILPPIMCTVIIMLTLLIYSFFFFILFNKGLYRRPYLDCLNNSKSQS